MVVIFDFSQLIVKRESYEHKDIGMPTYRELKRTVEGDEMNCCWTSKDEETLSRDLNTNHRAQ